MILGKRETRYTTGSAFTRRTVAVPCWTGTAPTPDPDEALIRSPLRRRTAVLALGLLALAAVPGWLLLRPDALPDGTFASAVAFSTPIPDAPLLDPDSDAMVALLGAPDRPLTLNTGKYGQPVYEATGDAPARRLTISRAGKAEGDWGANVLQGRTVRIPDDAVPSSGDDGKLVVVDRERGQVVDLWRAERTADGWTAEWGGLYPLSGSGSSHAPAYGDGVFDQPYPEPLSRGTGSGISSLAGVLRADELASGVVEHALVFVTDRACGPAQTGPHRWPATTTDGFVTDGPCVPQGARVQLDPALDLELVPGLTRVERIVGRALQRYGAYAIDIGGARMGVVTEVARTAEHRALYEELFAELGLVHPDFQALRNLPLDRARVLARWDGA